MAHLSSPDQLLNAAENDTIDVDGIPMLVGIFNKSGDNQPTHIYLQVRDTDPDNSYGWKHVRKEMRGVAVFTPQELAEMIATNQFVVS